MHEKNLLKNEYYGMLFFDVPIWPDIYNIDIFNIHVSNLIVA